MKYTDIPKDVLNEISYMLGSTEECNSEYLKPILERHGYKDFTYDRRCKKSYRHNGCYRCFQGFFG